jgi:hypothetical protein
MSVGCMGCQRGKLLLTELCSEGLGQECINFTNFNRPRSMEPGSDVLSGLSETGRGHEQICASRAVTRTKSQTFSDTNWRAVRC